MTRMQGTEELERLREGKDDWLGYYPRETNKRSRIRSLEFTMSIFLSIFLTVMVLSIIVGGHLVPAVLASATGIGGFTAEIENIEAEGIAAHPAFGPTPSCDSDIDFNEGLNNVEEGDDVGEPYPQMRIELLDATVPEQKNLSFNKDIETPDLMGIEIFRVSVSLDTGSENINLQNSTLYVTELAVDNININDAILNELFTDGMGGDNPPFYGGGEGMTVMNEILDNESTASEADPGELILKGNQTEGNDDEAGSAELTNTSAILHYVDFESLTLVNLDLNTEYGDIDDFDDPEPLLADEECPV